MNKNYVYLADKIFSNLESKIRFKCSKENLPYETIRITLDSGYTFCIHYRSSGSGSTYLNSIENNPGTGELFIVPFSITLLNPFGSQRDIQQIDEILNIFASLFEKFYKFPERHVFFFVGEVDCEISSLSNSFIFNTSATLGSSQHGIHFTSYIDIDFKMKSISDCRNIASFVGWFSANSIRSTIKTQFETCGRKDVLFRGNDHYFATYSQDEKKTLMKSWLQCLNDSKFIICPKGMGPSGNRFFECLKFGRIPVLVSDSLKLPLKTSIDYSRCSVTVPENDIKNIFFYIESFQNSLEASEYGKYVWNEFFKDDKIGLFIEKSETCKILM